VVLRAGFFRRRDAGEGIVYSLMVVARVGCDAVVGATRQALYVFSRDASRLRRFLC